MTIEEDRRREFRAWMHVFVEQLGYDHVKNGILDMIEKDEEGVRRVDPENPMLEVLDEERRLGKR